MSGIIGSKINIRGSGNLVSKLGTDGQVLTSAGAGLSSITYEDLAAGISWQSVVTGSTMTAVAGEWLSNQYKFKHMHNYFTRFCFCWRCNYIHRLCKILGNK